MGYLTGTEEAGTMDLAAAITRVMRQGGPGAWRQVWQIVMLRLRGSGLTVQQYYDFGLWRPKIGAALRRELLAVPAFRGFNDALRMPGMGPDDAAIEDKLATEAILLASGLPAVRTLAAFAPPGGPPPPAHVPALPDAAAVAAFLSAPPALPLFGKPRSDSFARGSAAITGLTPDGSAVAFLDGQTAPIQALSAEIASDYPGGYLFQPFHRCAAPLAAHVGPAMASVRITTLLTDRGVEPWYAVLRVPAKAAMHDADARSTRVWGLVDIATGKVLNLRDIKDPAAAPHTHWMNPETPLVGFTLPHWQAAVEVARDGHDCFRANGILGWDLFLTDEGPRISEVNANPRPTYQLAAGRGLRNTEMMPLYDRALAHARAVNARRG